MVSLQTAPLTAKPEDTTVSRATRRMLDAIKDREIAEQEPMFDAFLEARQTVFSVADMDNDEARAYLSGISNRDERETLSAASEAVRIHLDYVRDAIEDARKEQEGNHGV